jgi:magnesium transporter
MPFSAYYLSAEGDLRRGLSEGEVRDAFELRQGLLWVDMCEVTEEDGEFLERNFGFHHLAIEDCVSPLVHSPKVDDFGDYLFIIVHGINHAVESDIVQTTELGLFIGPHFVVSAHNVPLYSVGSITKRVEEDGRPMRRGADFLAYVLIDALVDNVMPTIDSMSDIAEGIEEEVIHSPQRSTLEAILKLKRSTLRLHRVMAPQRETLNRLSRGEFPIISDKVQIFYRDVYDHVVRLEDLNQTLRDRADNALATQLSSVANRQNEIMKVLSIVASIFLPLALVAGIYGMNFENMPELSWQWGYFAVLGFVGAVIVIVMMWFGARKWIKWLTWGRRRVSRLSRPFAVEPEKLIHYIGHIEKRPHL